LGFAFHIQATRDKNEPEGPCVLVWAVYDAPSRHAALEVFNWLSAAAGQQLPEFEELEDDDR